MKRLLLLLLLPVLAVADGFTPNLLTSGENHTWEGVVEGSSILSTNPITPMYDPNSNFIVFGREYLTIRQIIGINTALEASGSGFQIAGINYGWAYFNTAFNRGVLDAEIQVTDSQGDYIYYNFHTMPENNTNTWMGFSNNYTFNSLYELNQVGDIKLEFSGVSFNQDPSENAYRGPAIINPFVQLEYVFDICDSDPLSSPSCPGYEQALLEQQCSSNPLYSPSCPGYQQAFLNQQCSADPLFDVSCFGYADAFYDQQCSLDPLYDVGCDGYASAFYDQQCSLDPLYDSGCDGYQKAILDRQSESKIVTEVIDPTEVQIFDDPVVQRVVSSTSSSTVVAREVEEEVTEEEIEEAREEARDRRIAQIRRELTREKTQEELEQEALMNELTNVPGFDVYQSAILVDAPFYAPREIYPNQVPVDNRNAMRLLTGSNNVLYREMIDQQFR